MQLIKRLTLLVLLLCSQAAFALVSTVPFYAYEARTGNVDVTGFDPSDVCSRGIAATGTTVYKFSSIKPISGYKDYSCWVTWSVNGGGNGEYGIAKYTKMSCPANSTESGGGCTCNSGYSEEDGQCKEGLSLDQACGAAFYGNTNWSEPVRLEGNVSDGTYCQPMGDSIKPGLACAMNFSKNMAWKTDDGAWHSEGVLQPQMIGGRFQGCVPGLEPTEGPPDPAKPPEVPKKQDKTCPNGYQGQVGGETKCVPSYGYNGVDFAPKTTVKDNDKTRTETTTKTECASGKCTTTVTEKVTDKATGSSTTSSSSTTEVDRDWCAKAENKDKCAENGKPPYVGQGTGSSGGGGGDGDGEEKGGRCGAKGQPPCKIDETGTPDGEGKFDSLMDKIAQDHQQRIDTLNGIKSTGDKDTSMGFSGGFQWLQHKTCMPWNLGRIPIMSQTVDIDVNICAIEPYIAPVMNFLWILGTLFATVYRVSSVMGAKVE